LSAWREVNVDGIVTADVGHRICRAVRESLGSLAVELSARQVGLAADAAWNLVRSAADAAEQLDHQPDTKTFAVNGCAQLTLVPAGHPEAVLAWQPESGWRSLLDESDPRSGLLGLYLPICSATASRPITVGHLGQSLDGFIATHSGDSQFVTGEDNLVHMHRLRALCDAIVVGAGTVAADNPQLTTRRVPGASPLRAIVDPQRRLTPSARVFVDEAAPTLYFCGRTRVAAGETHVGAAAVVGIDETDDGGANVADVLAHLRERGCARVFVEGGGVTVSAFLEANLLDRLQITVAPVFIGDGRPAIRLSPPNRLRDCLRPPCRVFRMGGDVLFDCDLSAASLPPVGP
jgi:diaminohydroxyphosphoribosylaminopyrimidine deaminase/5-amino-6-(5-phosphoribosylamino)uracil reductase